MNILFNEAVKKRNAAQKEVDRLATTAEQNKQEKINKVQAEREKQAIIDGEISKAKRKEQMHIFRDQFQKDISDFKRFINTEQQLTPPNINLKLMAAWNFSVYNTEPEFNFPAFCKSVFKELEED